MEQIRDWSEEEDYDAIIEVLPELNLCQIQFLSTVIFRPDRNNAVSPKPSVSQGEQSLFQFFRK